jgi:hypothetical protein
MIKALLLIFDPIRSWERVVRARRSLLFVLFVSLLPLVVLSCAAEAYGLATWGKWQGEIGEFARLRRFSQQEIIAYEALQFLTNLFLVFMGAKLLKSLGETFHGRHPFTAAFTVTAYALSPLFLLRVLDAIPVLSPWITWAVGIVLSLGVLYQGVPRVMQPDPPHAFGLYLTSALLLVLISGLTRFVTAWWLEGKFKTVEMPVNEFIGRLIGS